ncbi:hypothetical protein ACFQRK_08930 [Parapedobacter sp. GCM10030251]|uniref:hypothetical protein n=1 Tax=Parapedobacter sp. GCM10030251 TaxID=3273419 RepID=UPI00361DA258
MPGVPVVAAEPDAALVYPLAERRVPVMTTAMPGGVTVSTADVGHSKARGLSFALSGCRPNGGCGAHCTTDAVPAQLIDYLHYHFAIPNPNLEAGFEPA